MKIALAIGAALVLLGAVVLGFFDLGPMRSACGWLLRKLFPIAGPPGGGE